MPKHPCQARRAGGTPCLYAASTVAGTPPRVVCGTHARTHGYGFQAGAPRLEAMEIPLLAAYVNAVAVYYDALDRQERALAAKKETARAAWQEAAQVYQDRQRPALVPTEEVPL